MISDLMPDDKAGQTILQELSTMREQSREEAQFIVILVLCYLATRYPEMMLLQKTHTEPDTFIGKDKEHHRRCPVLCRNKLVFAEEGGVKVWFELGTLIGNRFLDFLGWYWLFLFWEQGTRTYNFCMAVCPFRNFVVEHLGHSFSMYR